MTHPKTGPMRFNAGRAGIYLEAMDAERLAVILRHVNSEYLDLLERRAMLEMKDLLLNRVVESRVQEAKLVRGGTS